MLKTIVRQFKELTLEELYGILQLRSEVFVVEQDCVYQDLDGKDQKATHVFFTDKNKVIAYTRIFAPGDYFNEASIGRVLVKESYRKYSLGHKLMKHSIETTKETFDTSEITISAQTYLKKFYESHGFIKTGDEYLEDGIPHIKMVIN